jgi:ferredoxin
MPTVRYATSGFAVDFPDGEDVNLLRASVRNECGVPYRCASGNCGTDRVFVEEGAENLSAPRKRERDRLGPLLDEGWRLACQTYAAGDVTLTWDPDQRPLDENAVDKSLPSAAAERLKRRWLADEPGRPADEESSSEAATAADASAEDQG